MRRLLPLALVAVLAAACGSSKSAPPTTTAAGTPDPAAASGGHTLFQGTEWAVVVKGAQAAALHLVGNAWRPDRSGRVKVTLLGKATVPRVFQFAAELSAKSPLVESALWVDGVELLEKGGGLTATRGTIYGSPVAPLKRGKHVVVAYGRTATSGTAVARVVHVR